MPEKCMPPSELFLNAVIGVLASDPSGMKYEWNSANFVLIRVNELSTGTFLFLKYRHAQL
jgi:hypothetical protein